MQRIISKIVEGIKTTVAAGIRVSANTIVTNITTKQYINQEKFLHSLGYPVFIGDTPAYDRKDEQKQHSASIEIAKSSLDELLKLKHEFGMNVGTLINYPL